MKLDFGKMSFMALKMAVGAALATLLAGFCGLASAMTAGIIAILSIQNTKRATWQIAVERVLAFLAANGFAWVAFTLVGYDLSGFTVYLFIYTLLCVGLGWMHALAPISVLMTHYVSAGEITWALVGNEALLLLIGAAVGMLVNAHLHPQRRRLAELVAQTDQAMIAALHGLADAPMDNRPLHHLEDMLVEAEKLAQRNAANQLMGADAFWGNYVRMRASQADVLARMQENMATIDTRPIQYEAVCHLIHTVAEDFHQTNDVKGLLDQLHHLLDEMKHQPLPKARAEFESRAVLFVVLTQLEDFLTIKRRFAMRYYQGEKAGK